MTEIDLSALTTVAKKVIIEKYHAPVSTTSTDKVLLLDREMLKRMGKKQNLTWIKPVTDYSALNGAESGFKNICGERLGNWWLNNNREECEDINDKFTGAISINADGNMKTCMDGLNDSHPGVLPCIILDIKMIVELKKRIPELFKMVGPIPDRPEHEHWVCNYFGIYFGEYPQFLPSERCQQRLIELYEEGKLNLTGRKFFGSITKKGVKLNDEYEYAGKRYVKVDNKYAKGQIYSNTSRIPDNYSSYLFVEVSPILWEIYNDPACLPNKLCELNGINPRSELEPEDIANELIIASSYIIGGAIPYHIYSCDDLMKGCETSLPRAYLNGLDIQHLKTHPDYDRHNDWYVETVNELCEIGFEENNFINEAFERELELINKVIREENDLTKPTGLINRLTQQNNSTVEPTIDNLPCNHKLIYSMYENYIVQHYNEIFRILGEECYYGTFSDEEYESLSNYLIRVRKKVEAMQNTDNKQTFYNRLEKDKGFTK